MAYEVIEVSQNVSDAELERYLRRRDPLSSEYAALGREDPSPELDALVLARARAALDEDGGTVNWRRRRWPAFSALAATVVLSFAIITRITLDGDQNTFATSPASPPAQAALPAPASTSVQSEETVAAPQSAGPAATAPVTSQAASSDRRALESVAPATKAFDGQVGSVAGANEQLLMKRQSVKGFARGADLARSGTANTAAGTNDTSSTGPAPADSAERLADEGSPSVFQTYDALRAEQRERESEQAARKNSDAPAASAEPPTALSVSGTRVRDNARAYSPSPKKAAAEAKVAPTSYEAAAEQPEIGAPASVAPGAVAQQRDPMEWLKEIQELRAAGRNEEADHELALFRSVYPQIRAVYEVDGAARKADVPARSDGVAESTAPRPPTK